VQLDLKYFSSYFSQKRHEKLSFKLENTYLDSMRGMFSQSDHHLYDGRQFTSSMVKDFSSLQQAQLAILDPCNPLSAVVHKQRNQTIR